MKEYHVTDLMLWVLCEAKYGWAVTERLRKPWGGVARPVGSAVHVGLEALYGGSDKATACNLALEAYRERTPQEVRAELDGKELGKVEQGEVQVARCMQYYPYDPMEFSEVIGLEGSFSAPLGEGRVVKGTIDRLVRVNGGLYIHDVKTTGMPIETTAKLQKLRMQYPGYVWLLKLAGKQVQGVIVEIIQKPRVYKKKDDTYSVSAPAYHREPVVITPLEVERFEEWAAYVVEQIEGGNRMLNTEACLAYMSLCPYFELCLNPKRADRLAEEFVKLEKGDR